MFNPLNFLQEFVIKAEINESTEQYNFMEGVTRVLPLVGYFMILMTIIDCVAIVVPPNFRNPEWELSIISSLSDQSWAFLIGVGFVLTSFFHGPLSQIRLIEIRLIFLIRWFLLILGIAFFLSVILIITNTNRISNQIKTDFSGLLEARQELINNTETNLNGISDKNELLQISQTLGVSLNDANSLTADEIRLKIKEQIPKIKDTLPKQVDRAQTEKLTNLFKASIRVGIQLIIVALLNTLIWFKTRSLGSLF